MSEHFHLPPVLGRANIPSCPVKIIQSESYLGIIYRMIYRYWQQVTSTPSTVVDLFVWDFFILSPVFFKKTIFHTSHHPSELADGSRSKSNFGGTSPEPGESIMGINDPPHCRLASLTTNMAPENNPLEKELPYWKASFLGAMLVSGSVV